MRPMQRMSQLALWAALSIGMAIGLFLQFFLASRGKAPLSPPLSMPLMLVLLVALLLIFGLRLRQQIRRGTGAVNPFQAVRVLALARAGQIVGAVFGGFGIGLLLSLLGRTVPAALEVWLPMLLTVLSGFTLAVCGIIIERICQIPPGDDGNADGADERGSEPGGAGNDQPAFRDGGAD